MDDSIRLGRVLGIPIGVNWSILAVAVLFTFGLAVQGLPQAAPDAALRWRLVAAVVGVIVFFASILAHELGHSIAALSHGVHVHGITLWLLGGVAKLDRQAPTARAELQIAIAGPAVSAVVGAFFAAVTVIALAIAPEPLVVGVLGWLGGINLLLAVFNLAPAAPLDGGRVLTAVLWRRWGDPDRARVVAGRCGLLLGVGLTAFGLVQIGFFARLEGWVTALVGGFVLAAARDEIATAVIRGRLRRSTVGTLARRHPPPVPDSVSVDQLLQRSGASDAQAALPVIRWDTAPIGYVVPAAAAEPLAPTERSWTNVGQVMHRVDDVPVVTAATSVEALLAGWERGGPQLAAVVDERGSSIGTIASDQVRPLLERPDVWGRDRSRRNLATTRLG